MTNQEKNLTTKLDLGENLICAANHISHYFSEKKQVLSEVIPNLDVTAITPKIKQALITSEVFDVDQATIVSDFCQLNIQSYSLS